jgi:hypothetical protein
MSSRIQRGVRWNKKGPGGRPLETVETKSGLVLIRSRAKKRACGAD